MHLQILLSQNSKFIPYPFTFVPLQNSWPHLMLFHVEIQSECTTTHKYYIAFVIDWFFVSTFSKTRRWNLVNFGLYPKAEGNLIWKSHWRHILHTFTHKSWLRARIYFTNAVLTIFLFSFIAVFMITRLKTSVWSACKDTERI